MGLLWLGRENACSTTSYQGRVSTPWESWCRSMEALWILLKNLWCYLIIQEKRWALSLGFWLPNRQQIRLRSITKVFKEFTIRINRWRASSCLSFLTWVSPEGSSPPQFWSSSLSIVSSAYSNDEQVWGLGSASFCIGELIFPKWGNVCKNHNWLFFQFFTSSGRRMGKIIRNNKKRSK